MKLHTLLKRLDSSTPSVEWKHVSPIVSGWSLDEKYFIQDAVGKKYLMRIAPFVEAEKLRFEAYLINKLKTTSLLTQDVISEGSCDEGASWFLLLSWIEGETLDYVLKRVDEETQYAYGVKAGERLKIIHSVPVEDHHRSNRYILNKKRRELDAYLSSSVRLKDDEDIVRFVKHNFDQLEHAETVYEHSDFHPGNIVLTKDNELGIIDFNGSHPGIIHEEFYKLDLFVVTQSQAFAIGQIHGYFGGNPPQSFWDKHAVFVAHAALYSLKWGESRAKKIREEEEMRSARVLNCYQRFSTSIPSWYTEQSERFIKLLKDKR